MIFAALLHLVLYALLVWAIIAERKKTAVVLLAVSFVLHLIEVSLFFIAMGN